MGRGERRPRIALVYDVLYPWVRGGAEKRLWEIARRLPRWGFEPHLIGPKYWEGPRSIQREGVWLHGICAPRALYGPDGTRTLSEPLAYAKDLLPALLGLRVDLIDCCAFPYFPWFSARAVARLRGIPLLTTWPELWGPYWLSYLGTARGIVARGIEYAVVRGGTNHLCLSPFTERRLDALGGVDRRYVTTLPAGIDAAELSRYALPAERRDGIIFVGRLLAHKRVPDLLQALAIVQRTYPETRLTIVGQGPEESHARATITQLQLDQHVVLRCNLDESELYTLMGQARCLVMPSEREGQSIVVAEAQATHTVPIVAQGPETAAPDFVRDGENGLLYPVGDSAALARRLVRVLGDDGYAERLAEGAHQAAMALDWDVTVLPKIAALYTTLLRRTNL